MRGKSPVTAGFLLMLVATVVFSASDSFAANAQGKKEMRVSQSKQKASAPKRKDVIETPSKKAQPDSMSPGVRAEEERVDVVEGVGSKGDVYPSTGAGTRKDVIEKIR